MIFVYDIKQVIDFSYDFCLWYKTSYRPHSCFCG